MRVSTKKLAVCGLLIALSVLLAYFSFYIGPSIKISFKDIPIVLASIYGGPVVGMICGVVADLISAQGWVPQLAIAPLLMGLLPSLLVRLFRKKGGRYTFVQLLTVMLVTNALGPILITTLLLSDLYGMPLWLLFATRTPQYLAMAVLESFVLVKLLPILETESGGPKRMTYDEAIAYIHAVYWKGSKMGLSRTQELLRLLGNPEKQLRFVHVAGTNGKGSTCAMLASVLQEADYRVGLYTSPYITRFNERIQVNGKPIPDAALARVVSQVREKAESMQDLPTEFELVTAIAMRYFLKERCDIVVLEAGLGGELDSTNVIDTPLVAVITAMGYDHTDILGDTMTEIAAAKAGIIKEGGDVVIPGGNGEADAVFRRVCSERSAALHVAKLSELRVTAYGLQGQDFDYGAYRGLHLGLLGEYQPQNAALALETLEVLRKKGFPVSDKALRRGLARTQWPARFELLHKRPAIVVDGGHNPHGVSGTVNSLRRLFPGKRVVFVIGVMSDKDIDGMLALLLPIAERFYAVSPAYFRAMPAPALAERIRAGNGAAEACGSVREGMQRAVDAAGEDSVICAVGSLYMAGEIRDYVKERYHG